MYQRNFMYQHFLILLFVFVNTLAAASLPANSVVKISVSSSAPNYKYPWQSDKIVESSGSGVIIEGNRILTCAHVVQYAKFIQVTQENTRKVYTASVKYISPQIDLAILEIKEQGFFKENKPLRFSQNVKQGQSITVLGFPIGGTTISTTKGVISRIEPHNYVFSGESFLAIQVDAAINPGNSGGAAINEKGEVIGIAMQSITKASNISYVVPSMIVNAFLEDIKDRKVDGLENTKTNFQPLINPALRYHYGIQDDKGVVVARLDKNEHELRLGDILLSVDGYAIYNDGTIKTPYGQMNYTYAYDAKPVGQVVFFTLKRDNQILSVPYTLKRKYEIVYKEFTTQPRYLVYGGFIFSPVTKNYLDANDLLSGCFDFQFQNNTQTKHIKEAVFLQLEMLPHTINAGYRSGGDLVKSVNGELVEDFAHFVRLIDASKEVYTTIEFINFEHNKVILNTKKAKESFEDIKAIYGLSSDRNL